MHCFALAKYHIAHFMNGSFVLVIELHKSIRYWKFKIEIMVSISLLPADHSPNLQ